MHSPSAQDTAVLGIIPARYASTRFPGKPLALLGGKPVVQHVYERVVGLLDYAVVATDDERIRQAVLAFGGNVVMTSPDHRSGTDRCHEALKVVQRRLGRSFRVVINIQGDEPFIHPTQIEAVKQCFQDPHTDIATLVKPFSPAEGYAAIENPNSPKVVVSDDGYAMYFSRSPIPYLRSEQDRGNWPLRHTYYKHIGLYAYRPDVLAAITALPPSTLEMAESLEQLRWLQHGYRIRVAVTHTDTVGIDTPQDLQRAEALLQAYSLPPHQGDTHP